MRTQRFLKYASAPPQSQTDMIAWANNLNVATDTAGLIALGNDDNVGIENHTMFPKFLLLFILRKRQARCAQKTLTLPVFRVSKSYMIYEMTKYLHPDMAESF